MEQHILLKNATRKPYSKVPDMPAGAFFDHQRGYWIKGEEALIKCSSDLGVMVSKKCDQETGEDQKGE